MSLSDEAQRLLAWPLWAGDFVLQECSGGPSSGGWSNVPAAPSATNNEEIITMPMNTASKFYRLYRP